MKSSPPHFRFLSRPEEIAAVCARLRGEPRFALDLEADGLHSYREKICLVQISVPDAHWILDPLAGPDALAGLAPLLGDAGVRKILHGGDFDVRLLKRELGVPVKNLFDTMIAAQFAGREKCGLAALLEEHAGVKLDKKFQRADWSRRPLGPDLLAYAASDTAHLLGLADALDAELRTLGRLGWAEEEFDLLSRVEPAPARPPSCLDAKGASRLAPRQLARLQALLEARDGAARSWNRPPFKVLDAQILLDWAVAPPQDRNAIAATRGANASILGRLCDPLLAALRSAEAIPEAECPRFPHASRDPMTQPQAQLLASLKAARAEVAASLRLDPGLLVSGATLERLVRLSPAEALDALPSSLKRWQQETVGEVLAARLRGPA